jgi:hypothetical protein
MAVYGSVLESRLNLEFANEIKQFDYMMVSESSVDYILESKFSIKEVFRKLKELWEKFKRWIKEKFAKLRDFIRRLLHKTKTEVIDKKIEKPKQSGEDGGRRNNDKFYAPAVRDNTNDNDQQADEPQDLIFSYNTTNGATTNIMNDIEKLLVGEKLEDEIDEMENRIGNNSDSEYIDSIKQTCEEANQNADSILKQIEDTDYSNIKKVDVKIPFKNAPTDNFKTSVYKQLEYIKSATEVIYKKLLNLNRELDQIEKGIIEYDQQIKEVEKYVEKANKVANGSITFTDTDLDMPEDKAKIASVGINLLVNTMKSDISRIRSAVIHWSKHSGNLTSAGAQNQLIFQKLATMIGITGRPKPQTILSIEKSSTSSTELATV